MKIINLVDDLKSYNDLINEHGLSFYMETDSKKYLFDTGASEKFYDNAAKLDLKIEDIDALFISHNHYDHIGGLFRFMEVNKKAKIYIKANAVYKTFYTYGDSKCYLGQFHDTIAKSPRVVLVSGSMQVDNFHLLTDTNSNSDYFAQGTFYMEKDGETIRDTFSHEMFLVYIKDNKANIISACTHRGIINVIETAKHRFNLPINNVIAGFHLSAKGGTDINCTDKYFSTVLTYLKNEPIQKIHTCHCTGKYAYELLNGVLEKKLDYFSAGSEIKC